MHIGAVTHLTTFVLLAIILLTVRGQITNCNIGQTDPLRGCLDCTNNTSSVINITTNQIVCSTLTNCTVVNINGSCLQCTNNSAIDTFLNTCSAAITGCMTLYNNTCIQCYPNHYQLNTTSNTCILNIIDYCWKTTLNSCTQCSDQNVIVPTSNCSISSTLCTNFNYALWQCSQCPTGKVLHSSGVYCYDNTIIVNCLVINNNSCVLCAQGYYVSAATCQSGSALNLYLQLLPSDYYLNTNYSSQSSCISLNQYFFNSTCTPLTSGINYCLVAANSTCISCLPQFYLNASNICKPCSSYANCFGCDRYNCKLCLPSYYLVITLNSNSITTFFNSLSSGSSSSCLPCSIYGCLSCRTELDLSGINHVRCDTCLFGYSLTNYTCYLCSDGTYFNTASKTCLNCTVTGCQYCNTNPLTCDQCQGSYFYNTANSTCLPISYVTGNNTLTQSNAYEILNKSIPYSNILIVNDEKLLITNCVGDSNGYACLCGNSTNVVYSSLCYPLYTNITQLTLSSQLVGSNTTTLTKSTYVSNLPLLLLLSQLPNYNFAFSPAVGELISLTQLAAHLQIITNVIRNTPSSLNTQLSTLSQLVFSQESSKTFNAYTPTILTGKGYYFKFTPSTIESDNTTFASTIQPGTRQSEFLFIFINGTTDPLINRITGTAAVFLNQLTSSQLTLKLKKLNFLSNSQQYIVMQNNNQITYSISNDFNGYINIANITTSTTSNVNTYFVSSTASSATTDMYSSQRIQNIIYQDSFIYILVFLTLYLILVPLCALVDFVDHKASKRKVGKSEQSSYQGIKHRNEAQIQEQIVLRINYKDFFPIYNVANTDRPQRLLKVCLFIVNNQHGVTFLTLIYFHLPGGQPLIAVLLAIPAYLCTIVMGYLCGIFTLKVPGNWKYTINLITIGYWILWVAVMQRFVSSDYHPYVFTFTCQSTSLKLYQCTLQSNKTNVKQNSSKHSHVGSPIVATMNLIVWQNKQTKSEKQSDNLSLILSQQNIKTKKYNMEHNEETIKNKLWSIALQETHLNSETEFLTTFNKSKNQSPKLTSFREISDWTNKRQLDHEDEPTPRLRDTSKLQDQICRFSFLMTNKPLYKYQSQLLPSQKQKLELSPITMKFNVQSISKNLRKQRERNFSQMSNPPSFYQLNYRPLGLLYQQKRKNDNHTPKPDDVDFTLPEFNPHKLPRTQRVSSIMRLMKKKQEMREYRRRIGNSNQWQNFRIN